MQINMENLIKLLNLNIKPKQIPKSSNLTEVITSKADIETFNQDLKAIYYHFFNNNQNTLEIAKVMPFTFKKTKVPLCNKIFGLQEIVYKCYECFIHQAAVLCKQCFQNSQHRGHRFKKMASNGGNCDCGNPLALKQSGFCINHTGKVQIPEISPKETETFEYIFSNMFDWLKTMVSNNIEFASDFGIQLFDYLTKLNSESIYYNILTFKLIGKKQKNGYSFLNFLFHLKKDHLIRKINELFFSMFALDQFKILLTNEFLIAYNKIEDFESTSYHQLFIQLFANDNIILQLTKSLKNTIKIQKPNFDYEKYLSDLNFMTTISDKAAIEFFILYFQKNGVIEFPYLDKIESQFEKQDKMHPVDLVSNRLNEQNLLYYMFNDILKKVQQSSGLTGLIIKGIFNFLLDKKYSYRNNKAILPYHRILSMAILSHFKGQFSQINIKNFSKVLQRQEEQVINFYEQKTKDVLRCLLEFGQTFCRSTYFTNYFPLYVKSGVIAIYSDQLFIKQAACLLSTRNGIWEKMLGDLYEESQIVQIKKNERLSGQFFDKWVHFLELLLEIFTTNNCQIVASQKIDLKEIECKNLKKKIFKTILNKIGPLSKQQLKIVQKHFTGPLDDLFLQENSEFNKLTKKYSASSSIQQQFIYQFFKSKRKTPLLLFKQNDQSYVLDKLPSYIYGNGRFEKIIRQVIPNLFLKRLLSRFFNQVEPTEKQNKKQLIHWMFLLGKLAFCSNDKDLYKQLNNKIKPILSNEQEIEDNKKLQDLRMSLQKKKADKKQKMMEKQSKATDYFMKKFDEEAVVSVQQNSDNCIICRNATQNKESLFYFTNLQYHRLLYEKICKQKQNGFVFNTCFHSAHYSCAKQIANSKVRFVCPLCKMPCNTLLPTIQNIKDNGFQKSLERTQKMIRYLEQNSQRMADQQQEQKQKNKEYNISKRIFQYLIDQIGFVGLFDSEWRKKKNGKICGLLVNLLCGLWKDAGKNYRSLIQQFVKNSIKLTYINSTFNQPEKEKIFSSFSIRQYLLSAILEFLKGDKNSELEKLAVQFSKRVNTKDFQKIIENLSVVFGTSFSPINNCQIQTENKIPQLKLNLNFFKPPKTAKQLIQLRDSFSPNGCKLGHNACICIQCNQNLCYDCKTVQNHNNLHGYESIYFNLMTGGLTYHCIYKIALPSLYENKLGTFWTEIKQPESYTLNQQLYGQIIENLKFHTLQQFIQVKLKKHPQIDYLQQ